MALAVYVGKILASRFADIWISTISDRPPVGITPGPHHAERLEKAVSTVLDQAENLNTEVQDESVSRTGHAEGAADSASERLSRLALAETLTSHRKSLHAAIKAQGFQSWERVVAEDACEVCAPLAGQVQPVSVGFKDHPGCRCTLKPRGHSVTTLGHALEQESDSESSARTGRTPSRVTIRRIA